MVLGLGSEGRVPVDEPRAGCDPETVVGWLLPNGACGRRATGRCCGQPDWIEAFQVKDADRVPCCACGRGVMTVSEQSIH